MPIVRVELLAGRPNGVKQALAAELTTVVARHLGNDPAHIYVMFQDVAHGDWAVAGRVFDTPPNNTNTGFDKGRKP
ncbi:MAG: 4-oxalocrotonate tautomerase family protein [Betaproteobacteria bacterium]|nr:4-oxalocrotonate tautomerase family protein [Betaproteobacteria bacterium]